MFTNYNNMFVDNDAASACARRNVHATANQYQTPRGNYKGNGISMLSKDSNSYGQSRLFGGANTSQTEVEKLILSPSQCMLQPAGLEYFHPKKQVNVVHLHLSDSHGNIKLDCPDLTLPHIGKRKTRATQTLYRESSAQTLPYLPGVLNDPEELETLEVFKLPTILPGDGPPGLYEVEVLERARKRWAFAKALKENFRKQLEEARDQAKLQKHQHILEAFEWEHWLEREEYIQECQMLRLELLIRMFDKREQQMHNASHARIQKSCEMIEARRQAALRKNEIEYGRALRRLDIQHAKQPRRWRKENITKELGNPSSEFFAPKMRHGVNPNRRHFTASRKGFNMRMNDLEKKAVKMSYEHLKCPFAKLKEWSKPKELLQEVEQNFCSEVNLKKLYDSMRTLRESAKTQKTTPLCLKAKKLSAPTISEENSTDDDHILMVLINEDATNFQIPDNVKFAADTATDSKDSCQTKEQEIDHSKSTEELRKQKQLEKQEIEMLQKEMRCEELENLISSYEGHTIGWLMRYLSEEMCRLKEQRKLHLFSMIAQRERWHREASEAGLRQKENFLREQFEQLYEKSDESNKIIAEQFMHDIMDSSIEDYAAHKAEDHVKTMAKDLDKEISGWLESFREVQNPLNYHKLRNALKDIIMPDKEKILKRLETDDCIDYIMNDVLFANVYRLLEPYDVSFSITTDFVDRLIDNDVYLHSSDCSSECNCEDIGLCTCSKAPHEAMAILRKVIRRAVPGRRWHTPTERVTTENINDLLDAVFDEVIPPGSFIEVDMKKPAVVPDQGGHTDLVCSENDFIISDASDEASSEIDEIYKIKQLESMSTLTDSDITMMLRPTEKLLLADPDKLSADRILIKFEKYDFPESQYKPERVHIIPSTHDITSVWDFRKTEVYNETSSEDFIVAEGDKEETVEETIEEQMEQLKLKSEESTEDWELEMSPSHHSFNEQHYEEEPQSYEIELDNYQIQLETDEIVLDNYQIELKTDEIVLENYDVELENAEIELESDDLNTPKTTDKNITHFDEYNEVNLIEPKDDDAGEVMEVSFSYDATVKNSVPVPSGHKVINTSETLETSIEKEEKLDDVEIE